MIVRCGAALLLAGLVVAGCTPAQASDKKKKNAAASGCPAIPLDATDGSLIAPANHKAIYEDDDVRILDVTLAPRTTEPMHTHTRPAVLIFPHPFTSRYITPANPDAKSMTPPPDFKPTAFITPPEPLHAVENTGDTLMEIFRVEIEHPGCGPLGPGATAMPAAPPSADGTVAAAQRTRPTEDDDVRIVEETIAPHTRGPAHANLLPAIVFVDQPSSLRIWTEDGAPPRDVAKELIPVRPFFNGAFGMRSIENTGDKPYHAFRIELKRTVTPTMNMP